MYLIDTDVLIWVLRGNKDYQQLLLDLKDKSPLAISTITIAEIYKNIFPSEIIKTDNILDEFQVLEVSIQIAKQAGLYFQEYSSTLKNLSLTDCLIASTANLNNAPLVTLNTKHFPMKDVKLFNPGKNLG